jgi:DNA polymerase-3 subunit gamma/tau
VAKKKAPRVAPELDSSPRSSGYTVLARRYRPQVFTDLVGQEPVARALINALQSNRVAHAYLFTGPRGVGKTSTARILAKSLNCVQGPTASPCGKCDICRSVAEGDDVDVIEIDGASNRGIDEIRELRSNVQYRPARARFKIYIIDEVHMLTPPAFNALLKTLEEPPAHVKFIFATTEAQKIPATILSRCQRFDFAGIGIPRIVQRLREIVTGEGMAADDEALELVARRAGGSMRDSQSLLDQLLAFGGERLTVDQVHQLLGTAHDERVAALAAAILEHDAKKTLELLGQAADEGLQLAELLDQLLDYWRDLMVCQCTRGAERAAGEIPIISVGSQHREALAGQASGLELDTILAGLDILSGIKARMRGSSHGRILMEMGLVRLGRLDNLVALSQLAQWLGQPGNAPAPRSTPALSNAVSASVQSAEAPEPKKKPLTVADAAPASSTANLSQETLPQIWTEVVAQVGPMLGSHLGKHESIAISGPNTLVLRFSPRYNAAREHCQDPNSVRRVEEAFKKVTGRPWSLRVEAAPEGGGSRQAPSGGTEEASPSPSRSRQQRLNAMQKPLVKSALDLLGAQIIDMDEGFGATPEPSTIDPPDGTDEG